MKRRMAVHAIFIVSLCMGFCLTGGGPAAAAVKPSGISAEILDAGFTVMENHPDSRITFRFHLDETTARTIDPAAVLAGDRREHRSIPGYSALMSRLIRISPTRTPHLNWEILAVNGSPADPGMFSPTAPPVELGRPAILGNLRVARLTIHPVLSDRITGDAALITDMRITITMDSPGKRPAANPLVHPAPITRSWDRFYRSLIPNYVSDGAFRNGEPENYLIIAPDDFESRLQGFIAWKEAEGYRVDILRLSELPAYPAPADLKAAIQSRFDGQYPPVYVLICGDETDTPIFLSYDPTHPGDYADDLYYSLLAGDDNLPDVFQSRLPAEDGTELTTMLNKIMHYERNPQMDNLAFYQTALMAGSALEESQVTTKEQTRERLETYCGYTDVHTYYTWSDAQIENIMNDIESGVSIINYRGEGWRRGWNPLHEYWFDYNLLSDVENAWLTPFVTSIGCGVAMFNTDGDCWAETFISMGSPSIPMGAVGVIGPTWNTHTTFNNWIDRGIYRGYVYWDVIRAGPMMDYGKLYMADYFPEPENEVVVDEQMRTYLLFGTPDMLVRTGIPQETLVDLSYDNSSMDRYLTVRSGDGELVENALVSWSADGMRQVYLTTEDGAAPVPLTGITDDFLHVTVTGKNLIPAHADLPWIAPGTDGQLIITEIKPDVPTTGGEGDTVEIYNSDMHAIDLRGWILTDTDQFDTPFVKGEAILLPQQLAVITFAGPTMEESIEHTLYGLRIRSREIPDFSSLEDVAVLRDPHGRVVDCLAWHDGTSVGSTNAAWDLSRLTGPTSAFDILDSGWWDGPDTITNEEYNLYSIDWSPFEGNGGDGSIQRSTVGSPDGPGNFTIQADTGFGFYTHGVVRKSEPASGGAIRRQ